MKSLIKREQGFTLIEIVIVLAIAAALILVVFLAVTGAQKSKRDSVTRSAAGQIGSQMENYLSNNGGTFPSAGAAVMTASYIGKIVDGSGAAPTSTNAALTTVAGSGNEIVYAAEAKCAGSGGTYTFTAANANNYAVMYYTESSGAQSCIDNQ